MVVPRREQLSAAVAREPALGHRAYQSELHPCDGMTADSKLSISRRDMFLPAVAVVLPGMGAWALASVHL